MAYTASVVLVAVAFALAFIIKPVDADKVAAKPADNAAVEVAEVA